jgi:hypothetical protein
MRRRVAATVLALTFWMAAAPASAFVAEVTTSVAVTDATDAAQIENAIHAAVKDVLEGAIAFTPTVAVVTRAVVMGGRVYVRLLLADKDGEETFGTLNNVPATPPAPAESRL